LAFAAYAFCSTTMFDIWSSALERHT
jgi:hypothetical protein